MKTAAIVATVGIVTASQGDAMNALHINVNKYGQKKIQEEFKDLEKTAKKVSHMPATKELAHKFEKLAKSKPVHQLKALDMKFKKSPMGKKLVKEWTDVGEAVEDNIVHTKNGIYFPNKAFDKVNDELDDVQDHYETIGKSHWAPKFKVAIGKVVHSKEAEAAHKGTKHYFTKTPAGKMLGGSIKDLGMAVKKNVHVSDIPKEWKKKMNGLKVEVDEDGQEEIMEEVDDIKETWEDIKDSEVVHNVGDAAMKWGTSTEVDELKALDKKFKHSKDGKKLIGEWKELGDILHKAIEKTPHGFKIHNSKMGAVEDQVEEIEDEYDYLETTHWNKDFHDAFEAAFTNPEAKVLGGALHKFKESEEGHELKSDIEDLIDEIKENVEVTDVPKHWKKKLREGMH